MKIWDFVFDRNKFLVFVSSVILVGIIGYLDKITGTEIAFSIFYLLPVALTSWFVKRRAGFIISVLCAIAWYLADRTAGAVYSHSLIPFWNGVVGLFFFMLVAQLLSSVKNELEMQKHLAMEDFLTKASNGRAFFNYANIEISRIKRYKMPLTIVYLDLDNFKQVNDSLGHNIGDELLITAVNTIRKNIRVTDAVGRLGGDEFAILLPDMDASAAAPFIKYLREKFDAEMKKNNWNVTFSAGVVTYIKPPENVDEMIKLADNVMYSVKKQGKNNVKFIAFD